MKYILLVTLICSTFLGSAQGGYLKNVISDKEETQIKNSVRQKYWKNNGAVYKKEIPEQWKEESALILERNIVRECYRNTKNYLRYISITQEVLKLQNQAALEDYSELYFSKESSSQAMKLVEIRIVKPDGSTKEINVLEEGIEEKSGGSRVKIALSDLEIGDIIDYYEYSEVRFLFPASSRDQFDAEFLIFNEEHPILTYNFLLTVGPSVYFNGQVVGVDDFKHSSFTRDKKSFHKYTLRMENVEEYNPDVRWTYPYQELPNLRYQVFVGQNGVDYDHIANICGERKYNKQISKERLKKYIEKSTSVSGYDHYRKEFLKYTKENKTRLSQMTQHALIHDFYDFYKAIMVSIIGNKGAVNYANNQFYDQRSLNNAYKYIGRMSYFLNKYDIENNIVLTFNKRYTSNEDYKLVEEIIPMIKVKDEEGNDIFLCPPTIYTCAGDIPAIYQGTIGQLFNESSGNFEEIDIPATTTTDNGIIEHMDVTIVDFKNLKIVRKYEIKGSSKESDQRQLINIHKVIEDTNEKYDFESWDEEVKNKYKEEINSERKENEQKVLDNIEKEYLVAINDNYDSEIEEVESFEVLNQGFKVENPNLVVEEKFSLPDYVKKLGHNYMIPIGKLIGGQVAITEVEKMERKHDIYMPSPRSYDYTVALTIPEGFSVSGLENLDMNVSNETGSFVSSAQIEGGELIISTSKTYNNYLEPKANWTKMIEFLDAAYNFTDQKILLKKGS